MSVQGYVGTLRPLPASALLPKIPVAPHATCHQSDEIRMRANLAADNFLGRAYPTKGVPAVGRGVDGFRRNAIAVGDDARIMRRVDLSLETRIAAGSKIMGDVDSMAFYEELTEKGVRQAAHKPLPTPASFLTGIHRAGAVGNLVLARYALPELAVTTVAQTSEAVKLSKSPTATKDQRRDAWRTALYSQAAVVSVGTGLTSSLGTLASGNIGSPLTRGAMAIESTDAFTIVDKASRVLAPIADGAMLVADGLNLRHTMENPQASTAQQARAWFNVGLSTVKVATHVFPHNKVANTAYAVIGCVQFGLAAFDQIEGQHRYRHAG